MKADRCRAIMERAAVVLALVMGIVTDQRAGDQGIFVQNTGTADTIVLIEYKSGESEQVSGLPPMGTAYFPTASWQGSAVVSADQPVAAIAVLTGPDGTGTAFPPSHALGTQFSYPFFDHTTGVCLQNPGSAPANVTIDFLNAEGQSNRQSVVPAGDTLLLAGSGIFPDLSQPFSGSAVLSSDQPVSSVAFHQTSSGATRFWQSLPEHVAVMPGFAGSGLVALSGTEAGTVSMSTWDQDGTQGTPFSVDLTVGEWGALPDPLDGFQGSAMLSGTVPIVVDYWSEWSGHPVQTQAMSSFSVHNTQVVPWVNHAPSVHRNTQFVVQNLGSTAGEIAISYFPVVVPGAKRSVAETPEFAQEPITVPANGTIRVDCADGGLPDFFLGGALIDSDLPIAVLVVVQTGIAQFSAYHAINPDYGAQTILYAPVTAVPDLRPVPLIIERLWLEEGMLNLRWNVVSPDHRYTLEYQSENSPDWLPFPPADMWPTKANGVGFSLNGVPGFRPEDTFRRVLLRVRGAVNR